MMLAGCGEAQEPMWTSVGLDSHGPGEADVEILEGFSTPESAHWHPGTGSWFVSNIVGETGAPDGQGWISRIDGERKLVDLRWVEGLDSPAGLTSDEDTLFVADRNRVLGFDMASRALEEQWVVAEAGLLNDPTLAPDGSIYVSDTFGQAVFHLRAGGVVERVLFDPALEGPNGLRFDGDDLLIGSVGSFTDFEDTAPLFRWDVKGNLLSAFPGIEGKFDGIEPFGGGFLLTDFRGPLLHLDAEGELTEIADLVAAGWVDSAADLGFDPKRRTVAIPDLLGDRVLFARL